MRARELLARLGDPSGQGWTSSGLADAVGGLVRQGRLPAGVDLPSERDLAVAIQRSRGTVARAYERLRGEGLAYTRHGAGTTIGCCAGPWASSRGAELVSLQPLLTVAPRGSEGRTIDLRSVRWAPGLEGATERLVPGCSDEVDVADARQRVSERIVAQRAGSGPAVVAGGLLLTAGRLRAIDVAVSTLLSAGDPVLVPQRTDPSVLALLRMRGLRPVGLPLHVDGRADVPGWLSRLRTGRAPVVLLPAPRAAPHGVLLAPHERRLVAELLAVADATVIEDLTDADLWVTSPSPPPLATFADALDRTISLGEVAALPGVGGTLGWLQASDAVLGERLRTVHEGLAAMPADAMLVAADAAGAPDPTLVARRREHLVSHTATLIQLVTPAAPAVSLVAPGDGPLRWVQVAGVAGSRLATALEARGVLVVPGGHWLVGDQHDPAAVTVSLAGPTPELVAGVRELVAVVADLR